MSFLTGGGGSDVKVPKLQQVSIPTAAADFSQYQNAGYAASDADWKARFPDLFNARNYMFGDAMAQAGGALPSQTTGALQTAGLGSEAKSMAGANVFQTARNEGVPILSLEQRSRNFAENLLAQNPERSVSLPGSSAVQIAEANTGNQNAFAQALFGTQLNQFDASQAQNAQNLKALTSIATSGIKSFSQPSESPYADPFSNAYLNNFSNWAPTNPEDVAAGLG